MKTKEELKAEMREAARVLTGLGFSEWKAIPEICKAEVYEDYLVNELLKKFN